MGKGKGQKDKQSNNQRKRTNNIMAKGKRQKDKQYNVQRKTTKEHTI